MREISFNDVKKMWNVNKYPVHLYIHSPYCKSICSYCAYKGNLLDDGFDNYFNNVLPQEISNYREIIDKQKIQCIYFGGGTPNFKLDLSNLDACFEAIRDIPCKEKAIELHMGIEITDETINKLKNEGFTTVILCQQTFNEDLLKSQNRISTKNDIKELIKKFHEKGINCGVDLIAFVNSPVEILISDVKRVLDAEPDEVSIAPLYQNREKAVEINQVNFREVYDLFKEKGMIPDNVITNVTWSACKVFRWYNPSLWTGHYLTQKTSGFFSFVSGLDDGIIDFPNYTSVLGIGSFNNKIKKTFSSINCQYFYCENFDGTETKYFLLRNKSFYNIMREMIDWMERVSKDPVPSGLKVNFTNSDLCDAFDDFDKANYNFNIYNSDQDSKYIANLNQNLFKLMQDPIDYKELPYDRAD